MKFQLMENFMRFSRFSQIILFFLFLSSQAFAATVSQVKGNRLLVQLDGLEIAVDSEFFILTPEGKRVGLAKVKAVKGERAVADLLKGRAQIGFSVQVRSAAAGTAKKASEGTDVKSNDRKGMAVKSKPKNVGGVLFGLANNSMSLTAQYGTTKSDLSMKDSGFLVKGFYDYSLTKDFVARLGAGLQMFSVKGSTTTNICENGASTSCEVAFTYLAAEAVAQYYFSDGSFRPWGGLGYHFLIAATKKNNIPNLSSDTSTNQMISFGAGFDYWMSKDSFIPFSFHYGMFPGSSNVSASAMIIQAGYGFGF
jgi:hypothetical protein